MSVPVRTSVRATVSLLAGPVLAGVVLLLFPATPESAAAARTAAIAVWMAAWWLTEAVPLAVTSLLPLALFPVLGIMKAGDVAPLFMNDVVFLFIGGFLVALAMEKWDLHRRIALRTMLLIGGGTRRMLLGFVIATGFISMWTSNTATAMMMVPIAAAVLAHYDQILDKKSASKVATAVLLGVAYAASIGGMATLVGTPPNLAFARIFAIQFPDAPPVTFAKWMFFALPLSVMLLVVIWLLLSAMFISKSRSAAGTHEMFRTTLRELGPIRREEKIVLWAFLAMVVLWISRESLNMGGFRFPGWSSLLPEPSFAGDGTVAIAVATLLFIVPSRTAGKRILDWETAQRLPWGIVLLFGGGFALAGAIASSGLDDMIGRQMQSFSGMSSLLTILLVGIIITVASEFASNTATAQMALPILAATSVGLGRDPMFLMVPATLCASCGFMLPVATPPNAIVFGTGRVRVIDMAKTGLILDIVGIIAVTLWLHVAGAAIFGGSPDVLPPWAVTSTTPTP